MRTGLTLRRATRRRRPRHRRTAGLRVHRRRTAHLRTGTADRGHHTLQVERTGHQHSVSNGGPGRDSASRPGPRKRKNGPSKRVLSPFLSNTELFKLSFLLSHVRDCFPTMQTTLCNKRAPKSNTILFLTFTSHQKRPARSNRRRLFCHYLPAAGTGHSESPSGPR